MRKLPENFRHVRLQLAREPGHPGGDLEHGYDLVIPLTADGHISADDFREHKASCRVRRFRPGEDDAIGTLEHGPGGQWRFDYDSSGSRDDEQAYRFSAERFDMGEYVSIREDDGEMHTFVVTQVQTV